MQMLEAESIREMMSPLPKISLKPTPVWYYTMIDLAGPVVVRDLSIKVCIGKHGW